MRTPADTTKINVWVGCETELKSPGSHSLHPESAYTCLYATLTLPPRNKYKSHTASLPSLSLSPQHDTLASWYPLQNWSKKIQTSANEMESRNKKSKLIITQIRHVFKLSIMYCRYSGPLAGKFSRKGPCYVDFILSWSAEIELINPKQLMLSCTPETLYHVAFFSPWYLHLECSCWSSFKTTVCLSP